MNPGFWTISLEFKALVGLSGEGVFAEGHEESADGHCIGHYGAANTKAWTETLKGGVDNFIDSLKAKMK